jgi:Fur family transcriptional regulator, zinc uptake regulator
MGRAHSHNHQDCINTALARAKVICTQAGVKLTAQRQTVLQLIWQSHKPLGAYPLMGQLQQLTGKPIAPPTVYRALEFLLEQGLIHRVHSLNAFVGCDHPGQPHSGQLLICRACGDAQELDCAVFNDSVQQLLPANGFCAERVMLEITGLCQECQGQSHA